MQNQQTSNPDRKREPNKIERAPAPNEDSSHKPGPSPERQRDPLQQPGELPDVKPDVIAGRQGGHDAEQGQGAGQRPGDSSRPEAVRRRKR